MTSIEQYRSSPGEKARTEDLLRILPKGRHSVLDIGARDGFFSKLLTEHFEEVTALDLTKPTFQFDRVRTVAGNITALAFDDSSFDCVFCAEVLEHIPNLQKACAELLRVARHEIVVGVPYKQDTRVGRTTCRSCGRPNPPWGHVNTFDEDRLSRLFPGTRILSKSFVGSSAEATNALSAFLMDLAGNPWGTYDQDETCVHCGEHLVPPENGHRPLLQRGCSFAAASLNRMQASWTSPHGNWLHLVFQKPVFQKPGD